jgi:hypothetical protein
MTKAALDSILSGGKPLRNAFFQALGIRISMGNFLVIITPILIDPLFQGQRRSVCSDRTLLIGLAVSHRRS